MEWIRRESTAAQVGVLAGAFNPPTRAHMALARAALAHVGEVVFVLPRAFPHKEFHGPTLEQRLAMLRKATESEPRLSVAVSEGGLFIEIARELRTSDDRIERVLFACGRDAAERIVGWNYAGGMTIEEQLREYELLVAARGGHFVPPAQMRERIWELRLPEPLDAVSSSELRARLANGGDGSALLAEGIEEEARRFYS